MHLTIFTILREPRSIKPIFVKGTTTSPDSPPSDEDTTTADDVDNEGEGGEEASV